MKRRTTPYPHTMIGIELGTATLNISACFMQTLTVCDNTSSSTDFSMNNHTVWTASLLDPPHKTICLLTKTFAVESFETPTYSMYSLHCPAIAPFCYLRLSLKNQLLPIATRRSPMHDTRYPPLNHVPAPNAYCTLTADRLGTSGHLLISQW